MTTAHKSSERAILESLWYIEAFHLLCKTEFGPAQEGVLVPSELPAKTPEPLEFTERINTLEWSMRVNQAPSIESDP